MIDYLYYTQVERFPGYIFQGILYCKNTENYLKKQILAPNNVVF